MREELEVWRTSASGFWDTAIKGSSSLQAALMRIVFAEVHSSSLCDVAFGLSDFKKFYDSFDWGATFAAASSR